MIALVGRPNTGKSTLFNRLTRTRRAVVAPEPGVTRDRNIAPAEWRGRRFLVVDTGGFDGSGGEPMARAVREQAVLAAEEADAVIVVLDARAGPNPLDRAVLDEVRRRGKPWFAAANKVDTPRHLRLADAFYEFGCARVYPLSAEHGLGVAQLLEEVFASLPAADRDRDDQAGAATAVAIVGRPNVGKSSLLNRLAERERSLVTPIAGTTRDAIDIEVEREGKRYLLVDTAGVRRRTRVRSIVERASVVRTLRAAERADVVLLVVDGHEGMTDQDARLGAYAWERGCGLVLVVNKWDLVPAERCDPARWGRDVDERYPSYAVVPKRFVSALTGRGLDDIWPVVDEVAENRRVRIPTADLNAVVQRAVRAREPAVRRGRRPRLFYAAQTGDRPPQITVFCARAASIGAGYERYLLNRIREAFPLPGVPLRLRFRERQRGRRAGADAGQRGGDSSVKPTTSTVVSKWPSSRSGSGGSGS